MDPLIEISRQEWPALRDLYKTHWPKGVVGQCILDALINHPGLAAPFGLKVYCPEGELKNGMIAITSRKNYYELFIQPIGDNMKIIEKALLTTNKIEWDRCVMVASASPIVVNCLESIKNKLQIDFKPNKTFMHLFSPNAKCFEDLRTPPDSYVGPLKPEHLTLVDKTWTFHSDDSGYFFQTLMENDQIWVLYNTKDHQPMAWVCVGEMGALTHLYTLEGHRRKGYAEFLTKFIANELLRQGRCVLAYTVEKNERPRQMFDKLGLENVGAVYWLEVERKVKEDKQKS